MAVGTSDNCVRVYNTASLKADWTLRGACLSQKQTFLGTTTESADALFQCRLVVDPVTRHVVTNGYPGQLQCLSVPTKQVRALALLVALLITCRANLHPSTFDHS